MTRFCLLTVVALVVMSRAGARAQETAPAAPLAPLAQKAPPPPPVQTPPPPPTTAVGAASIVPLKVTITLSKYQGDKKVSSLPYELTVRTDNAKASIRMTTQVPMRVVVPNPVAVDAGRSASALKTFKMVDVGTNIDCNAMNLKDGRYSVTVTVEDSSIYEDTERTDIPNGSKVSGASAWRTYRTTTCSYCAMGSPRSSRRPSTKSAAMSLKQTCCSR
jgi:hypothetical protein